MWVEQLAASRVLIDSEKKAGNAKGYPWILVVIADRRELRTKQMELGGSDCCSGSRIGRRSRRGRNTTITSSSSSRSSLVVVAAVVVVGGGWSVVGTG